jgi:hypothetical protein
MACLASCCCDLPTSPPPPPLFILFALPELHPHLPPPLPWLPSSQHLHLLCIARAPSSSPHHRPRRSRSLAGGAWEITTADMMFAAAGKCTMERRPIIRSATGCRRRPRLAQPTAGRNGLWIRILSIYPQVLVSPPLVRHNMQQGMRVCADMTAKKVPLLSTPMQVAFFLNAILFRP